MSLNDYQEKALVTHRGVGTKLEQLEYVTMGLCGEAGEVANKVKKIRRDHQGEITGEMAKDLLYEMGDVLWYLSVLAHMVGYDFGYVATTNIRKLRDRQSRGVIQGSGDER